MSQLPKSLQIPNFIELGSPKLRSFPTCQKNNPYSLGQTRILWNPPNVTRSLFEMTLANWPPVARLLMENVTDARIDRMKERGDYLVVNYPRIASRLVHPSFLSGLKPYVSHWMNQRYDITHFTKYLIGTPQGSSLGLYESGDHSFVGCLPSTSVNGFQSKYYVGEVVLRGAFRVLSRYDQPYLSAIIMS